MYATIMQMTQVFTIRHGETPWNAEGRLQGHANIPLAPKGLAQAKALAQSLKDHEFTAIYSSDLDRAFQTAECIALHHNIPIKIDARLREKNLGVFQSLTRPEISQHYPEEFEKYQSNNPDYQVPQGESNRQFYQRCIDCFDEIAIRHMGEKVLVVAHGGVLGNLFKYTVGIPLEMPRRFELLNTSLNIFTHKQETWILESWGNLSHLQHIPQNHSLDDL
jgi:probable phosphoglycerate mutase